MDRSTSRYLQAFGPSLPGDLTDAQWDHLRIPAAKPGGRPRKTDMRAATNAIFYLLRTGCPARYLPRGPFPPRSTIEAACAQALAEGVHSADVVLKFWPARAIPDWAADPHPRCAEPPACIARSCIPAGRRGRFFTAVDLVNRLEAETRAGRQGGMADSLR